MNRLSVHVKRTIIDFCIFIRNFHMKTFGAEALISLSLLHLVPLLSWPSLTASQEVSPLLSSILMLNQVVPPPSLLQVFSQFKQSHLIYASFSPSLLPHCFVQVSPLPLLNIQFLTALQEVSPLLSSKLLLKQEVSMSQSDYNYYNLSTNYPLQCLRTCQ